MLPYRASHALFLCKDNGILPRLRCGSEVFIEGIDFAIVGVVYFEIIVVYIEFVVDFGSGGATCVV
jgi:hypothetical protein